MHSRVQQGLHFFLPCIWCLTNQNIENTQNATVAMFLFYLLGLVTTLTAKTRKGTCLHAF